jgi:hypothetical protein
VNSAPNIFFLKSLKYTPSLAKIIKSVDVGTHCLAAQWSDPWQLVVPIKRKGELPMLQRPRPWFMGLCHHLLRCRPTLPLSPAPTKMVAVVAMTVGKSIFLPPPSTVRSQFLTRSWPHLDFLPRPRLPPPPPPLPPPPSAMIMTIACIHVFMCEFTHKNLCRMSNTVRTRSIIVTQGEMLQLLHQSIPQQLDRIQFWGACGQELEKYSVIVPR